MIEFICLLVSSRLLVDSARRFDIRSSSVSLSTASLTCSVNLSNIFSLSTFGWYSDLIEVDRSNRKLKLQTCSCELSDNSHKKSSPFERFRELSRFPRGLEDSGATICPGQWYICSRQWFICWFSPNWATNQDVQRRAAAQFLTICWHADGLRVA